MLLDWAPGAVETPSTDECENAVCGLTGSYVPPRFTPNTPKRLPWSIPSAPALKPPVSEVPETGLEWPHWCMSGLGMYMQRLVPGHARAPDFWDLLPYSTDWDCGSGKPCFWVLSGLCLDWSAELLSPGAALSMCRGTTLWTKGFKKRNWGSL